MPRVAKSEHRKAGILPFLSPKWRHCIDLRRCCLQWTSCSFHAAFSGNVERWMWNPARILVAIHNTLAALASSVPLTATERHRLPPEGLRQLFTIDSAHTHGYDRHLRRPRGDAGHGVRATACGTRCLFIHHPAFLIHHSRHGRPIKWQDRL